MKKVLLFIAFIGILCACDPPHVSESRKIYKSYFNYVLKDPKSLEIHSATYTAHGSIIEWKIDYSAKNSFGGNVRKTTEIVTYGDWFTVDGTYYKTSQVKGY